MPKSNGLGLSGLWTWSMEFGMHELCSLLWKAWTSSQKREQKKVHRHKH
jgi:hypothetical protein